MNKTEERVGTMHKTTYERWLIVLDETPSLSDKGIIIRDKSKCRGY